MSPRRLLTRRTRRRLLWLVGALVFAWLVVVAGLVVSAALEAQDGRRIANQAKRTIGVEDLARDDVFDPLEEAEGHFSTAHERLSSPFVAPLEVLPFVGRQVRSLQALSGSAAEALAFGGDTLEEARELLGEDLPVGEERVTKLRRLSGLAGEAVQQLDDLDLGPREALAGPLVTARNDAAEEIAGLRDLLERGQTVTRAVADLLEGPTRYVVVAANNAEMRAGSGMFLNAGPLTAEGGRFDLGPTASVTRYFVEPGDVPLEGDYGARWGFLNPGPSSEWRNLALSPRFDASAALAVSMWQASGQEPATGVLAVDPYALQAVLRATGPVVVDGKEITARNVVQDVLHDQYLEITTPRPNLESQERRERLGRIAEAALDALGQRRVDGIRLLQGMDEVIAGRHLLAWSSDPGVQEAWVALGVDGEVHEDSLLVSVLNRGANKLDWFLGVDADLQWRQRPRGIIRGRLTLTVHNRTPPGQPEYIAGPVPSLGTQYGDYLGIVTANVPGSASRVRIAGGRDLIVTGPDGPTRVVGTPVLVPRGESEEVVVTFDLPEQVTSVRIEPTARSRPVRWSVGRSAWANGQGRTVVVPR